MAQYPKITITNAGLNMIAESQGGTSIIFTKMVMGDGLLADGENIKVMTNVKNAMLAVPLQGFTNQNDGQIRLRFTVSNSNLETGFFAREIGVFAKMGATGAEQLYAYTNAGNKSDYLPDKSVPLDSQILDLYLVVGNATNISAVLDGNASYATKLDMTEHDISETAHSVIINNLKTKIESAGINLRKNSKTYVVGDVAYSLNLPTWARLDCIQGGTTASIEPTWGTVTAGQVFTDGEVQWRIADVKSSGDSVGSIKAWLVKNIPAGWLDISTGAMVSRATYPELWSWVQANTPLISEADWQTQANAQSSVGAFSTGDGSTTFRLPRIVDYVRGGILADVGMWQGDAIRNITGNLKYALLDTAQASGAFAINSDVAGVGGGSGSTNKRSATLDISTQVPTADENRPKTIKMVYCVKAFGSPTNQGLIDITALANEVAGKQTATKYIKIVDKKTFGTAGGTFTSGAWRTRDLNTIEKDDTTLVTVSSNQITLPAGTYEVDIMASAQACNSNRTRLYNITGSATLLDGSTEYASATYAGKTNSYIKGKIILANTTVVEIQHYCTTTGTYGTALNVSGIDEIYTTATFRKMV